MDEPILTVDERNAVNAGRWFASLSPSLRHDILRCATVRRYRNGEPVCLRGAPTDTWSGVAKGAARISGVSVTGKLVTLAYMEPGVWYGEVSIFDDHNRTHDVSAHGKTTIVHVSRTDFLKIAETHAEFYPALMRLNSRRLRRLFEMVEDLSALPLRARLAKQLLLLIKAYGNPDAFNPSQIRIGLNLAQSDLAQLLGASRQRVNYDLKMMERESIIRMESSGLVVCDILALIRIGDCLE